jgi:hypothetical protein
MSEEPSSARVTPLKSSHQTEAILSRRRRAAFLTVLLIVGALIFAFVVNRHHPIAGWLFFRYLRAGALAGVFALTCLIAGHSALVRVLGRVLPLDEHVAVAFPLGIPLFFLASFLFGVLGLYGAPFFLLCPALLIALGARDFFRTAKRLMRHVARLDWRLPLGPVRGAVLAFGCLGVIAVWFPILTPQNASYDARWYHLPLAEHYVAQGGITPFSEGWVAGGQPHLASLLYAWAFSMPGNLFDRLVTGAHIEFSIFLMTLVGVAAMTRRVLGARVGLSWAALFLFPGIFCYDSGLVLGADHVAAVFAAPILLLSVRYFEAPTKSHALLLAAAVAGALNTKYTAAILLPLPLVVVITRTALGRTRASSGSVWIPAGLATAALVALTAPHWLKNALFYGDPLFPLLRRWLPARPWSEAADAPYAAWFALWSPAFSLASVLEMAKTLVTFSFVPHDFPQYHGDVPVFGSLFTLFTPLLLFVQRRRRLGWLFAGSYLGIAAWFFIHQLDRYLQVLVPWMAAASAAVLIQVWREGGWARLAVSALVGLQIVWGAHVPFIPAHRAAGGAIYKVVVDLLGHGYANDSREWLTTFPEWEAIGRALPSGAKVLVHEEPIHLGISAASAQDYSGYQGVFYWGEPGASSPREVWTLLRAHGITHVVWADRLDHATDTVAGGLVFFEFATRHTRRIGAYGGFALGALYDAPPADVSSREVAYYGCDDRPPFVPGLYPLGALVRAVGDRRPLLPPISGVSKEEAIERAQFIVFDARCHGPLPEKTRAQFELLAARGQSMLMVRR